MKISKPLRGRRAKYRLDLSDIRAVLRDQRQWTAIGVVEAPDGGGAHFEVVGDNADVHVNVVLQPDRVPIQARLAGGMWIVPDVGDEVAVIIPAGEVDFMPVITCILSHAVPSSQGPAPQTIVIARGPGSQVLIHDGDGGAEPLVKKSEFDGHTHDLPAITGSASYGPIPPTGAIQSGGAGAVTGTEVLKAK